MFEKLMCAAIGALVALAAYALLKPMPAPSPSQQPAPVIDFTTRRDGLIIREQVYGEIPPCERAKQPPCVGTPTKDSRR